jgi:DNA N-6-adenine-methyltransferase (Dam)/Protein of unknown function (DUF3102)
VTAAAVPREAITPRLVDQDAVRIGSLYRAARKSAIESARHLIEAGQRLAEKKKSLGHGEWLPWLAANAEVLGFRDRSTASRLMAAGKRWCAGAPSDESEAVEVGRAVWGTPAEVIAMARSVLGEIDLDPASCETAQTVVQAKQFFTKQDDGLKQPWCGRLWLNPPQPLIGDFISKLVKERNAGNISAAIVLSHNFTDAAWFHELAGAASRICFTSGRIKFLLEGSEVETPPYGQAVTYVGDDAIAFERAFGRVGLIVAPATITPAVQRKEAEAPDHDWEEEWQGMPEFQNEAPGPYQNVNVLFDRREDVEAFGRAIGQTVTPKTKAVWFPARTKRSRKDVMFFGAEPDPELPKTEGWTPRAA